MLVLYIVCFVLGVGDKDLVWMFFNFFVVLVNCVWFCGVDIDFVDIEQDIGNMCMDVLYDKLEIVCVVKQLFKVVIFVYFLGQLCNMK